MSNSIEQLNFDNRFVDQLPADASTENISRQVRDACYSWVTPLKTSAPELLSYSKEVCALLNIDEADCSSENFTQVFSGNQLLENMTSYATCYGGHQFGQWAGQLGDGRAINLGEIVNKDNQRWAIQLKGAGPTPYSRHADGLAVLRSSIREYLCSEAMYHLGVPTTRALSICLTGDSVPRDMFYDGHVVDEPGAVVCRVAPSFTRFGHFQILAAQLKLDEHGKPEQQTSLLKNFIDYTIKTDFSHLAAPCKEVYVEWFREVCQSTKDMVVQWMRVGFVHGVMNTDNMSILGLTIDYGPYGWLEGFDEQWTPNTTDASGKRYCFGRQASMAHWNLAQLAQAILPIVDDLEALRASLDEFCAQYEDGYHQMMLDKLGLFKATEVGSDELENDHDQQLIIDLLEILQSTETDMTLFFRNLADLNIEVLAKAEIDGIPFTLEPAYYQFDEVDEVTELAICQWLKRYAKRALSESEMQAEKQGDSRKQRMNRVNPLYVMRNYLAQEAIVQSEQGDQGLLNELLDVMRNPYTQQQGKSRFAEKRPEWARNKAGCSMLSCSS